eukprot:scaffold5407_cov59-Cyclotella_meneghiniana.AAC.1
MNDYLPLAGTRVSRRSLLYDVTPESVFHGTASSPAPSAHYRPYGTVALFTFYTIPYCPSRFQRLLRESLSFRTIHYPYFISPLSSPCAVLSPTVLSPFKNSRGCVLSMFFNQ